MDGSIGQTKLGSATSLAPSRPFTVDNTALCVDRSHPLVRTVAVNLVDSDRVFFTDTTPRPRAREYLIMHPEITLDDFVVAYSRGFNVNWPYDPASVLLPTSTNANGTTEITVNPVFEEHMRQIRHWTVGDFFRVKFPELSAYIDADSGHIESPGALGVSPPQSHASQGSPP